MWSRTSVSHGEMCLHISNQEAGNISLSSHPRQELVSDSRMKSTGILNSVGNKKDFTSQKYTSLDCSENGRIISVNISQELLCKL